MRKLGRKITRQHRRQQRAGWHWDGRQWVPPTGWTPTVTKPSNRSSIVPFVVR